MVTIFLLFAWNTSTMTDERLSFGLQVFKNTNLVICWAAWSCQWRAPQEDCEVAVVQYLEDMS